MRLIDAEPLLDHLDNMEMYIEDRMPTRERHNLLTIVRSLKEKILVQKPIEIPMKTTERGKHEAVL